MAKTITKIECAVLILILTAIPIGFVLRISNIEIVTAFYGIDKVDALFLGDKGRTTISDPVVGEANIVEKDVNNKRYGLISRQIKHLYISPNQDESNNYQFNDLSNFKIPLALKKDMDGGNNLQIIYDNKNNQVDFVISSNNLSIAENIITAPKKILYSLGNISADTILEINGIFYVASSDLKGETTLQNIKDSEIKIFKTDNKNLLNKETSSFENGLWQKEAGDCSDELAGTSKISTEESLDSSDGLKAVKLISSNHYACIRKTFPLEINIDELYKVSFDYKNVAGNDIRYYYKLYKGDNEKQGYAFAETIYANDTDWHSLLSIIDPKIVKKNLILSEYNQNINNLDSSVFTSSGIKDSNTGDPINGIKYMDIFFYAPSDGSKEIVNLYDNVHLIEYNLVETKKINLNSLVNTNITLAENISLISGVNTFEHTTDGNNLLDYKTASFEDGLWQNNAADCSNNKPGVADILLKESNESSDGKSSVELSSKNHYACTSKTFPVALSNGKTYKLQFDYKNIKGSKIMYYYNLHSDGKQNSYSETIEVKDNNWHTFERIIDPGIDGVKSVDIFFYAPSDGSNEIINLYDNVRLTEWLPKDIDSYYLYAQQEVDESPKLKAVEYKAVNLWKNKVVLHSINNSFLLAYPEEYSENWKAYALASKTEKLGKISDKYSVPESESNRQATKDEANQYFSGGLISTAGDKFISKNFDGSIRNDNLDNGNFYDSWFKESIAEDLHFKINDYGNSWWIDIDDLCKSGGVCKKNEDGTFDIELIIENKMLKWLYTGLLISGTILAGYVGYLGYDWRKRRKKKVISLAAYQERDSEA